MLPLSMLTGAFFNSFFQQLAFLMPWLIFSMLFITYCKLSFQDLKFSRLHLWLLLVQVVGCMVVYSILVWFDPVVAQGCLICVLAPTAKAAAVITGMLGGSVACLAAYTLISSLAVAVVSPVIFSLLGAHTEMGFWEAVWYICRQVMPLLILPCVTALLLEKVIALYPRPRVLFSFITVVRGKWLAGMRFNQAYGISNTGIDGCDSLGKREHVALYPRPRVLFGY